MISIIEYNCLNQIQILDKECFDRGDNLRSIDNLQSLMANNPNGCFTISDSGKIVGYIFSRVLGNVGYIGPLGVNPEFRKKGFGKAIIEKGTKSLIDIGCKYVGLEVLPELGNNIGLYLKECYIPSFSTITFKKIIPYKKINDYCVINGKDIDIQYIKDFDDCFKSENDGYSFIEDIILAISQDNANIYFYKKKNKVVGFLCYSLQINPFVWGAFLYSGCEKSTFNALFSRIESDNIGKELRIRVNSRYLKSLTMIDNSFIVERSILRMMQKGFEGRFMSLDERGFVARSWVG